MHLPDTLTRNNNKVYEEVSIPPSDPAPTHVGDKRVNIDKLDEVSLVFDVSEIIQCTSKKI